MVHRIHPSVKLSRFCDLEDSVRGSVLEIAEDVVIESFVKIKFAGGHGDVVIGPRSYINAGVVIYSGNGVRLGTGVLIAANTTVAATNHEIRDTTKLIRDQGFMSSKGGIVIEDDVWIGANCVILDGAHIGKGSVVGAGSCVRGVIEPYSLVGGNPLRVLGKRGQIDAAERRAPGRARGDKT